LTQNSIVAYDKRMKEVLERALRVARVDSTILVTGESGVGKEGIVHYIHENSNRRHAKLVKINCGAIPEQLLESELFGYSPGAFTGANSKGKKGLFEIASGGTIFLDEIGEMPLSLQVKLLRVIQEGEMTKVGDIAPMKVDIRIIVATNRDLKKEVENKRFREDLYYRLNIIPIHVPPLRERKDDIIPLVYHFLNKLKEKYGIHRIFSGESLRQIESYHWPGNVRELQNFIERLCLVVNKPVINLEDIRNEWNFNLLENETHPSQNDLDQSQNIYPLKRQLEDYEKEIIIKTLQQCPSMRQAAKALQIDPSTLLRKMQKYNIQR
ncbi:MAG TPA: sigma-54 dependent transcriptional regulator, partial [Chondromyces sp.]|nr:sigma-54 dependent transcriptional regulator [Chondromyces sp.]